MEPTDRAAKLKREADALLDSIGLAKLCEPVGKLIPTGSYLLDLIWKIDIWSADLALIQAKNQYLEELGRRMTPQQRQLILDYKFTMLNAEGRTPRFSGIHIYRAVIEHGLHEFDEISRYLRERSIDV